MNELDALYQRAVDEQAQLLLTRGTAATQALPDFGSFTVMINDQPVSCGFWHYRLSEAEHVVFQLQRKLRFNFYRKYLSGVKVTSDNTICLLTDDEAAEYD
jgi:hypothetical protein